MVASMVVVGEMEDEAEIECRVCGVALSCDAGCLWWSLWLLWLLEKCSPWFLLGTRTGVGQETIRPPQCEPRVFMVARV